MKLQLMIFEIHLTVGVQWNSLQLLHIDEHDGQLVVILYLMNAEKI